MQGLTVHGKMDGFGAQFMAILSGIAFCRRHDIPYVHTPIEHILPVGTFATDMNDRVVDANEFIDAIIERLGLDRQLPVARSELHMHDEINKDPDAYYTPEFTQFLASAYRVPRPSVFEGHSCNIAVHVRRGDVVPEETVRWVESDDILLQMNRLRALHPDAHFHVFSWKDSCAELDGDDVTIHCSESGKDFLHDFNCFVHANVLIVGASCLSMAAALFNTNKVIAPTVNRKKTNWANHAIPSRWYWDSPASDHAKTRLRSRGIDLRKTKVFVINLNRDEEKRSYLSDLLNSHGFTDVEFVAAQELDDPAIGCTISHAKVLHTYRPQPPFIVMEDDLAFTEDFTPELTVPGDADCIYLGRSAYGVVPAHNPKYALFDGCICSEYDEDYFRIYNMLAAHCILYLTDRYVEAARRQVVNYLLDRDWALYHDVAFANLQKYFNVFTPSRLQTFQTADHGGDEGSTNFEIRPNHIKGAVALTHPTEFGTFPFNLAAEEADPKVVTVDLVGGLGNTLFTVATAYAYAKRRNAELVIGEKEFIEGHCSEISPHYPDGWPVYWDTVYRKLDVANLNTDAFHHVNHWDPQGFVALDDLIEGEPNMVCLHGYFQNVQYFDDCRDDLIALFREPPNHIRYYIETKYRLSEYDRVLIIGVRQSKDYEENGWLLPASYYVNAYRHFSERCRDDRVLAIAIADEIGWVETNLSPHIPDLVVVDERENGLDLHMSVLQFYIMMHGTDFILSNSTFHWWGAYLADTKMILSPAEHFNPYRVFMPKPDQYQEIDADPIPKSVATKASGKEHAKKRLVVEMNHDDAGFFVYLEFVINAILYCESNEGWVSVPKVEFGEFNLEGTRNRYFERGRTECIFHTFFSLKREHELEDIAVIEERRDADFFWQLHSGFGIHCYPHGRFEYLKEDYDSPYTAEIDAWYWENRQQASRVLQEHVAIREEVMELVSCKWNSHVAEGEFVVGCHVRGTDKRAEIGGRKIPPDEYFPYLDRLIELHDARIFLATDDATYLEPIMQRYGNRTFSNDVARHPSNAFMTDAFSRYRLGLEALVDCLMLSRSDFLVKCSSGLSEFAVFFNPELHTRCLNLQYDCSEFLRS